MFRLYDTTNCAEIARQCLRVPDLAAEFKTIDQETHIEVQKYDEILECFMASATVKFLPGTYRAHITAEFMQFWKLD